MTSPQYLPVDPMATPPAVTPADSPSDPRGYAMVTPPGAGTAPYSIQAPMDDLTAVTAAARQLAGGQEGASTGFGAGSFGNVPGPRQAATARLMDSPQGFNAGGGTSGWDITPGYSGSADDPGNGWPNNPQPTILATPDQGQMGTYPDGNTGTD